uniref:Uncharacterized protein n=1 Tax=Parascaris equorum TaxID=6256 RepID=A0A914RSW5_PAREQ
MFVQSDFAFKDAQKRLIRGLDVAKVDKNRVRDGKERENAAMSAIRLAAITQAAIEAAKRLEEERRREEERERLLREKKIEAETEQVEENVNRLEVTLSTFFIRFCCGRVVGSSPEPGKRAHIHE